MSHAKGRAILRGFPANDYLKFPRPLLLGLSGECNPAFEMGVAEVSNVTEGHADEGGLVTEGRAGEAGVGTEGRSSEAGAPRHEGSYFLPFAAPHLQCEKSASSPNSKPSKLISSLGASEKSMPAKVTRTSLFAGSRRHAF